MVSAVRIRNRGCAREIESRASANCDGLDSVARLDKITLAFIIGCEGKSIFFE
jgi:hypothetical protein